MFDKFFKKQSDEQDPLKNESAGRLMLMGILTSSPIIFNDVWTDYKKRKGETFELIILSTLLMLRKFRETIPRYYSEFEKDLFTQIHIFARQEQIIENLPCDFSDFINSRFVLYSKEFSVGEDDEIKLPVHTVYNLFEIPLLKDSGVCEDIFKIMETQIKFNNYFKQLVISFNFMVSKKYA